MDILDKINEVKNSQEINKLKIKKEELSNLTLNEVDVFDNIHYLLGKFKKGIELVEIKGSTKNYGHETIFFSRIGIRYKSYYESYRTLMNLEDVKKEFKSEKVLKELNKHLKPEGQEILKQLLKEILKIKETDSRENTILCSIPITIEKEVYKILDKDNTKVEKYPKITGEFDFSPRINIEFNSYESIELTSRDDFENLAIEERYYNEVYQCANELIEKIKEYNKKIDNINSSFKTTFAKYLLLNNI